MPGTTPGIFIYVVFGTTAASRQKFKEKFYPKSWLEGGSPSSGGCCFGRNKKQSNNTATRENDGGGGIHVERSLTITSASRMRASQAYEYDDDQFSDPSDISMSDLPKRPDSSREIQIGYMKSLPLAPNNNNNKTAVVAPASKFTTRTVAGGPLTSHFIRGNINSSKQPQMSNTSHPAFGGGGGGSLGLSAIEEKSSVGDASVVSRSITHTPNSDLEGGYIDDFGLISRTNTDDSLRVPDDYLHGMGPEHSDDSGPILPIQRPEVRFAPDIYGYGPTTTTTTTSTTRTSKRDRMSKNFSRPRK